MGGEDAKRKYNREYIRKWRKANPDAARRICREWYEKNKGAVNERRRLARKNNPEAIERKRRYRDENRIAIAETAKKYREKNKDRAKAVYDRYRDSLATGQEVYVASDEGNPGRFKLGFCGRGGAYRVACSGTWNSYKLFLVGVVPGNRGLEQSIHRHLRAEPNEWTRGGLEWFEGPKTNEVVDLIKSGDVEALHQLVGFSDTIDKPG